MAVIELAAFHAFTPAQLTFMEQLAETIGVVLNTIQANMRTEELLDQSQSLAQELQSQSEELQTQQEELQQRNEELEETAATLRASEELLQQQQEELQQTNEELEEKARQLEEQNARIEIKNQEIELARVGARGEGGAARALVEVQERVPREHVARAANAAQLAADPREAARRQPRRQPDAEAGRVLVDDPLGGLGPARPDQRHPRPLEGGGREDGPRGVGDPAHRAPRADRARVPAGRRAEAARVRGRRERRERAADDRHRPAAARADPAEPALERVQVHGRRERVAHDRGGPDGRPLHERAAEPRRRRRGVRRLRHRDRDPARQAAPDLRGVPAGRRDDEPPLRRHRARPLDQPRDRGAARRRDPGRVEPRQGRDLHAVPARDLRAAGGTRARSSGAPCGDATATSPPSPSRSSTARSCCRAR